MSIPFMFMAIGVSIAIELLMIVEKRIQRLVDWMHGEDEYGPHAS